LTLKMSALPHSDRSNLAYNIAGTFLSQMYRCAPVTFS